MNTFPLLAIFLSGFGSLILEVVWTKVGIFKYGSSIQATTIVFSLFMAGLAIGNALCVRLQRSIKLNPFLAYGVAEVIGAIAGLSNSSDHFVSTILLSTLSIGFTIPLLVQGMQWVVPSPKWISRIYALNTIGAALGALTGAFLWIPHFGLKHASFIGASFMLIAGSIGIVLGLKIAKSEKLKGEEIKKGKWNLLLFALLSGFFGLSLEILWTRLLSLVLGPSVYAIGGMLFVFLLGIGFGSAVAEPVRKRFQIKLSIIWIGSALAISASAVFYTFLPYLFVDLVERIRPLPEHLRYFEIVLSLLVLFPVALLQGLIIPILVNLQKEEQPLAAGKVLSANTVGSIVGALATGLFLIPHFGFLSLIVSLVCSFIVLSFFSAMVVERNMKGSLKVHSVTAVLSLFFIVTLLQVWDKSILSSGVYKYAVGEALAGKKSSIQLGETLYFREGAISTVSVTKTSNDIVLSVDGKADATFYGDLSTQTLLAALPLSLSQRAERTLVIGYASGVTAGVASLFEGNHVTAVEIEPVVYDAALRFFQPINYSPLRPPMHQMLVGDGRHFLAKTNLLFDVITSEPSNPWMSGVAPLFTKEFFTLANSRLSQGGVMCQWLPIYGMTSDIVVSVLKTFSSVFPHVGTFYSVEGNDLLLIGGRSPLPISAKQIEKRWQKPEIKKELSRIGIHQGKDLLKRYVMGLEGINHLPHAPFNTDDNGFVEYQAPWAMHLKTAQMNDEMLRDASEYELKGKSR